MIVRSEDGTLIFCESFPVSGGRPRGALLVVHGIGEHSGRYAELIKEARGMRLDVHVMDLRGHGRSQGIRGHFSSLDILHQDLDAWISHLVDARALSGDLPCFLLGHSLGGLVALTYLPKYTKRPLYPDISGLCLSAPALGLRRNPLLTLEAKVARHLPKFLQSIHVPTGISAEMLTHDQEEVRQYREDPLVHGWITPAAFLAMERGMGGLRKTIAQINVPVLFLLSGRDQVVNTEAAAHYATKLAVAHPGMVEVRIFHTFFHEPFHETKRERAYLELKKWMLKCQPPPRKNSSRSSKKEVTGKVISP